MAITKIKPLVFNEEKASAYETKKAAQHVKYVRNVNAKISAFNAKRIQ